MTLIADHVWRCGYLSTNGPRRRTDACGYMNCGQPPAAHERTVGSRTNTVRHQPYLGDLETP